MKVLLFGGTFDPPHNGHINNLRAALRLVQPDVALVMPAGTPPHKAASATPGKVRLAMCKCFCVLGENVQISDWEIAREGKSYTVNTLHMLQEKYPDAELFFTLGSDMLLHFKEWHCWQEVLHITTLVVESREENDVAELKAAAEELQKAGGKILFAGAPAVQAASSEIRAGHQGKESVPESVWRIILKNHLYGISEQDCEKIRTKQKKSKEEVSMDYQTARKMVKRMLGAKRYDHSIGVKKMAVKLAKKYGADPEKAALAAILHDAAKEMPRTELLQILSDNAIMANNAQNRPAPVWHGVCASILAQTKWGVSDAEVLSAIACHTTGKAGMSLLDKILFLADMTSSERDFPGVEELRKLEFEDIDKAMILALEQTIGFVEERGNVVDSESRAALCDLREHHLEDNKRV